MRAIGTRFFLVFVLLALFGCSIWTVQEEKEPIKEATLPELLEPLVRRTEQIETLNVLVSAHIGGRPSVKMSLFWKSPETLRLKGFGPLGKTLFEFNLGDDGVEWRVPGRAPVVSESVEALVPSIQMLHPGFPVTVQELVYMTRVLTGPLFDPGEFPFLETTDQHFLISAVRLEGGEARLTKRLWIERRKLHLVRQDFFEKDGSLGITLHLLDYQSEETGEWAYSIGVKIPNEATSFSLVIRELIVKQKEGSELSKVKEEAMVIEP